MSRFQMPFFRGGIHKPRARKRLNGRSMGRVQQIRIIIIDRPLIHPLFLPRQGGERAATKRIALVVLYISWKLTNIVFLISSRHN